MEEPRPEGHAEGYPQVAYDPKRRQNYHVDAAGERVYHGVPAGFEMNDVGELVPAAPAAEEVSDGTGH